MAYPFSVANRGHVFGNFQVQSHDIYVAIVQQDGLRCIQARQPTCRMFYNSGGRAASGQIDTELAPGTYYVVFSNQYAAFFTKNIITEIYLED
jgi:hypothetical protein